MKQYAFHIVYILIILILAIAPLTGMAEETDIATQNQESQSEEADVNEATEDHESLADRIPEEVREQGERVYFFLENFRRTNYDRIAEKRAHAYERMQALRGDDGYSEEVSLPIVFIQLSWWHVLGWIFGSALFFYIVLGLITLRIISWVWRGVRRQPDWDM